MYENFPTDGKYYTYELFQLMVSTKRMNFSIWSLVLNEWNLSAQ